MEAIKDFEESEFTGASRESDSKFQARLQPLNESGSSTLLQMVREGTVREIVALRVIRNGALDEGVAGLHSDSVTDAESVLPFSTH